MPASIPVRQKMNGRNTHPYTHSIFSISVNHTNLSIPFPSLTAHYVQERFLSPCCPLLRIPSRRVFHYGQPSSFVNPGRPSSISSQLKLGMGLKVRCLGFSTFAWEERRRAMPLSFYFYHDDDDDLFCTWATLPIFLTLFFLFACFLLLF